ncbi:hypothetical protein Tco_1316229 [Tanacetum coccineum]
MHTRDGEAVLKFNLGRLRTKVVKVLASLEFEPILPTGIIVYDLGVGGWCFTVPNASRTISKTSNLCFAVIVSVIGRVISKSDPNELELEQKLGSFLSKIKCTDNIPSVHNNGETSLGGKSLTYLGNNSLNLVNKGMLSSYPIVVLGAIEHSSEMSLHWLYFEDLPEMDYFYTKRFDNNWRFLLGKNRVPAGFGIGGKSGKEKEALRSRGLKADSTKKKQNVLTSPRKEISELEELVLFLMKSSLSYSLWLCHPTFQIKLNGPGNFRKVHPRQVSMLINKSARELVEIQEQMLWMLSRKLYKSLWVGSWLLRLRLLIIISRGSVTYTAVVKMTDDQHVVFELLKNVLRNEQKDLTVVGKQLDVIKYGSFLGPFQSKENFVSEFPKDSNSGLNHDTEELKETCRSLEMASLAMQQSTKRLEIFDLRIFQQPRSLENASLAMQQSTKRSTNKPAITFGHGSEEKESEVKCAALTRLDASKIDQTKNRSLGTAEGRSNSGCIVLRGRVCSSLNCSCVEQDVPLWTVHHPTQTARKDFCLHCSDNYRCFEFFDSSHLAVRVPANVYGRYIVSDDVPSPLARRPPLQLESDLLPIIPRNLRIVSSGVKSSSRWLPVWEFATRSPTPFAVWSSTKLGQRDRGYLRLVNPTSTLKLFDPYRSLVVPIFAQSVAPSVGPATISPVKTKSITTNLLNLLFRHNKQERRNTTTGFFDTNPNTRSKRGELPPITVSIVTARTPGNTPLTNHASTSTNPDPLISPNFIEANYEVLESLLRERRKQIRNEDLRVELDYYSEEYDEEREMEPRPARSRETTHGGNPSFRGAPTYHSYGGHILQAPMSNHGPTPNRSTYPSGARPNSYLFYTQPVNLLPNAPAYLNYSHAGLFANHTGCVTPFVRWIEDYPLPDGLNMPSHVGSYDRKGDPDNYLHLFEGAIRMQKWAMLVACHMSTYTLKDSARIWWVAKKQATLSIAKI